MARRLMVESPVNVSSESHMRFRVVIERDEDGIFVVECPSLPGCVSQGPTRAEALKNIREAIDGYLASLAKHNEPIPPSIDEEVVEIIV